MPKIRTNIYLESKEILKLDNIVLHFKSENGVEISRSAIMRKFINNGMQDYWRQEELKGGEKYERNVC